MSYTDINTPVIEKITLPSGTSYFIADRQIREVVQSLSDMVAGGVSYIIAWDGVSAPVIANIPAGVVVKYNNTNYTGILAANNATPGAFYLVKSSTLPTEQTLDIYQEYVPIGSSDNKTWEKVGDTKINLVDVVKNVTLDKQTDTVIGTDSTFTVTQPTITAALADQSGTGKVGVVTAVSATTKKLATTTVTGVSGSTTASKATAGTAQTTAKGTGTASTTNTDWIKGMSVSNGVLTFGAATLDTQSTPQYTFSDVTVPTAAASATTVATGSVTTSGSGADVITATSGTTKYLGASASGAGVAWNSKDSVTVLKSTTDVNVTKNS